MLLSRNEVVALAFLLGALSVGGMIAKQGRSLLWIQESGELGALASGLDLLLLVGLSCMGIYTRFYSASVALAVAPILALILAYRLPYRIWKQNWPFTPRLQLVIGTAIVITGSVLFVFMTRLWMP
jgi:hypothetical protein